MAKLQVKPTIEVTLTLSLSEQEARALEAVAGYGTDAFLKVFYEHMGKSYLQPHEEGLRSLFESSMGILPLWFQRIDDARKEFYDAQSKDA